MTVVHLGATWGIAQFAAVCFCFVGYGFMWTFPSQVAIYTSGYFIVYQLALIFLGVPFYYVSLKLGATTQSGIILMFRNHVPVISGIGIACIIKLFLASLYIQVYASYFIFYCFNALVEQNPFRWSKQSNDTIPGKLVEEQFFLRNTLQISEGIDQPGGIVPHLGSSLFLAWLFTFLLTLGGVKYFGKIMIVTGLSALAMVIAVMAYGREEFIGPALYQDNSRPEDDFYNFHSDKSKSFIESLDALQHNWTSCINNLVLWSMMWHGVLPTIGKCIRPTKTMFHLYWLVLLVILTVIPHLFVNLFAPYLVSFSLQTDVSLKPLLIDNMYEGKLPFVILPRILTELGLKKGISFIFYLLGFVFVSQLQALICIVVIDNVYEVSRPSFKKFLKSSKIFNLALAAVYCVMGILLSLPMISRGGYYVLVLVENWLDKWLVFLILIALVAYVITFVSQNYHVIEKVIMMIWFIASSIVVLVLVGYHAGFQDERSHRYSFSVDVNAGDGEDYQYVGWAYAMGWFIALGPLVLGLIIGFIISAVKEKERTKQACQRCAVTCCLMADGFSEEADMNKMPEEVFMSTIVSNRTTVTTVGRGADNDYHTVDEGSQHGSHHSSHHGSNHGSHHSSRVSDRPVPNPSPVDYAY